MSEGTSPGRCARCGTALRPSPLPWLGIPLLLGALAFAAIRLLGDRLGSAELILLVTLPFAGFLLALWRVSAAWAAEDPSRCRGCGADPSQG